MRVAHENARKITQDASGARESLEFSFANGKNSRLLTLSGSDDQRWRFSMACPARHVQPKAA